MNAKGFTLDTNIITALIKKDERVKSKINEAYEKNLCVTINAITYYEIKRGLGKIGRLGKIKEFENICHNLEILFIDEKEILDYASSLWVNLSQKGLAIEDADILIASIATVKGYILVSNDSDFERVTGLKVENWLK